MHPGDRGESDRVAARTARRRELTEARRRRDRFWALVAGLVMLIVALAGALVWRHEASSPSAVRPHATSSVNASTQRLASDEETLTSRGAVATRTAEASPPAAIVIGWVGDTTPGSKYGNPPDEGRALFAHTRDLLSEPDITVANLEGTYGKGGPSKCDGRDASQCYAFQAPPAYASALSWAGIDVVNLANNHSHDYLANGLAQTKRALDKNGVAFTGLTGSIAYKEVNGTTVAFVGFSPYSWSPSIGDLDAAAALVREADRTADIVVVLMHAGAEGADKTHTPQGAERAFGEFRGDSRAFSHAVIDAGADVVLGSGPHVVRGMEQYRGRLIAYSLGNFAGWRNFSRDGKLGLSGMLAVRVAADGRVLGGTWHPLKLASPGVPKKDPDAASLTLVRKLSSSDFDKPVTPDENGDFTLETP